MATCGAGQLLAFVRRFVATGESCILISHLLGEILENADRIVVMRDGKVVAADARRAPSTATGWWRPWAAPSRSGARPRAAPQRAQRARRCACAPGPRGRATAPSSSRTRARSSASPGSPAMARRDLLLAIFDARARGARRRRRGDRAGGAGRRRPPVRRHLPAMVDRREHRHPLARRPAPTAC